MAKTITVTYKVNEDGSLSKIEKQAKKTAKGTKDLTGAADNYSKKNKGVAQAGMNSTKAFSKMTTGITGGLVPAYATLAANVFALTALFGALSKAASLRILEEGLLRVGNAAGANLKHVAQGLRDITGAAISTEASMRSVALAVSSGFSTEQLASLTKVAKGASIALGRDMTDAMDRLVRGTAKLEPEILDELGIMVRLDDATEAYAITLNKSATDLSQYERRMAFLNATNEQGLKKFGALADSVDVNPYDKLSATFTDLSNTMINLLNVVVEPFVNFFSRSKWALGAAIAMFASVLIKQITPAINASAAAATAMATHAHSQVVRLTAKTETAFKNSAKKVSSFQFAPKGLTTFEAGLRKGTASSAGLKDAIKKLQNAEKSRQRNIKKHHNANTNYHLKDIAQKDFELKKIQQLKAELIALNRVKNQESNIGDQGIRAKGTSTTSRKTAAAFKMMDNANPLQGFKIAAASTGKQVKDIGKATGALNKLSIGFGVAGNSAKLFGTAFLRAIPFVGQLAMAYSILSPIIESFLPKQSAVSIATDKATKSFESFDGIGRQLAKSLNQTADASERFMMVLRAKTGIIEQVITALKTMQQAVRDQSNEELQNAMRTKILADEKLRRDKKAEAQRNKEGRRVSNAQRADIGTFGTSMVNEAITLAEEAAVKVEGILAKSELVDKVNATIIINRALSRIASSVELTRTMEGEVAALKELKVSLLEAGYTGANLDDALANILGTSREVITAVDNGAATWANYRKEVGELGRTGAHAFDKTFDAFQAFNNELDASLGIDKDKNSLGNRMGLEAFMAQAPQAKKILRDFDQKTTGGDNLTTTFSGKDNSAYETISKNLIVHLNEQKAIMIEQKQLQKGYAIQAKKINKFVKGNAAAMEAMIVYEQAIIDSKETALAAELATYNTLLLQEEKKDRIAEIIQEQANLELKSTESVENLLRVDIERIGHAKKMLEMATKISAAEMQITANKHKQQEIDLKLSSRVRGGEVKPIETERLFKQQLEEKRRSVYQEMSSKLLAINLEFQLLTAQTKLQKERARIIEVEDKTIKAGELTAIYDTILAQIPQVAEAQMRAVVSDATTKDKGLTAEGSDLQEGSRSAATGAAGSGASTGDRITNFGANGGFEAVTAGLNKTSAAVATFAAQKALLDPMLDSLAALGVEGELVSGMLQGAAAITTAFLKMGDAVAEVAERPGWSELSKTQQESVVSSIEMGAKLQVAGQAVQMLGSALAASSNGKIAGIDQEIAAEKKRDGKSKESIAKMAALEKKKEAMAKKAFNVNKAISLATIAISTAAGVMNLWADPKMVGSGMAAAMTPWVIGLGVAQAAIVASTSYKGGSTPTSAASPPSSVSMGERTNTVDLGKANNAGGELAYMRGSSGQGTGATNFKPTPAFAGYNNRAGGGYIVGEQGPEVFMPDTAGSIIPSGQGMGGSTNVSFNIQAIDASGVEDVLIAQKGQIIRMIREAANEHGEFFLEGVREEAYQQ